MGLFKAWKGAKAVIASGTADGHAPHSANGMFAGFAGVIMKMMGPLMAAESPERGDPLPGTEAGVLDPQDPQAMQAGIAAVTARDAAFDTGLLTSFADQVFAAVSAAWGSGDAASARPVLADALWEPLAAAVMTGMTSGPGPILSRQVGHSTLAGVWAGPLYDSARFSVAVSVDLPNDPAHPAPPGSTAWNEDWLFQRSVTPGARTMSAAETCPSCGAPASTDAEGACTHCHQPIPVLTTGWLLTCIRAHNPTVEAFRDQMVAFARENPDHVALMPDEALRLLPAQLVAEIAPDRAAALHLRP